MAMCRRKPKSSRQRIAQGSQWPRVLVHPPTSNDSAKRTGEKEQSSGRLQLSMQCVTACWIQGQLGRSGKIVYVGTSSHVIRPENQNDAAKCSVKMTRPVSQCLAMFRLRVILTENYLVKYFKSERRNDQHTDWLLRTVDGSHSGTIRQNLHRQLHFEHRYARLRRFWTRS